ncbi:MAG TPA: helix-turn-helix domain-containing protein [Parvibaculum sp.]
MSFAGLCDIVWWSDNECLFMSPPDDKQPNYIDCYRAEFPQSNPQSAALFAQMLSPVFDFEVPSFAQGTPFFARSEIYGLPDLTVSRAWGGASRYVRTIKTMARHGMDQILVVCYTRGPFTMTIAGKTKRVEPGALAFIDMSQEIIIEAAEVENVSLAVSRRKLEMMVPFLDDAHGFVREPGPLSSVMLGMMEDVMAEGPAMPVVDAGGVAAAIIQLAAACLEPLSRQQVATSSGRNLVSLVLIKAAIERRLSDPDLRPQALLDEFAITRSTLYRLFEPLGGVSTYITERRLHYAFRRMADAVQPPFRISELAFELGFRHPSAFTRAFKDFFGMSPTEVRALAAQSKMQEMQLMASPGYLQYFSPITPLPRPVPVAAQ